MSDRGGVLCLGLGLALLPYLAGLPCLALATACVVKGENSVSRRLVKPVTLTLTGRVVSVDDRSPLAGMAVTILRAAGRDAKFEPTTELTTSASDGAFSLTVALDVEQYIYLLQVSDPEGDYATDSNTDVYAISDGTVSIGDVALVPAVREVFATIRGQVLAAVGGEVGAPALADVMVQALDPTTQEPLTEAVQTDAEGVFELPDTPLDTIDLQLTAAAALPDASYRLLSQVTRTLRLERELPDRADAGAASLDVGRFWIPPASRLAVEGSQTEDFMTIVLSWEPADSNSKQAAEARDLGARLYLPGADCDVNHMGGKELALATGAALDPAGMGSGTCFWPPFLGGRDVPTVGEDIPLAVATEHRVLVSESRAVQFIAGAAEQDSAQCPDLTQALARDGDAPVSPVPDAADCGVAVLNHVSSDGSEPEVLTLFHDRFTRQWPEDLGYYYELEVTDDGEWARRYPMAIAAFSVVGDGAALAQAKPVVEVYDRGAFVARYSLDQLEQQTVSSRWTPFLIELGSKRPSATSSSDLYARVESYDQVLVSVGSPPYFYQDVGVGSAEVVATGEIVSLTGASGVVSLADGGLTVLGQTRVEGALVPAAFSFDEEEGWSAQPFTAEETSGLVATKNGSLVVALGPDVYLDGELLPGEQDAGSCGSPVLDLAADPDDPELSFLLATEAGLAYLRGPSVEGDSVREASCVMLEEQVAPTAPAPPPPAEPKPVLDVDAAVALDVDAGSDGRVRPTEALTQLVWMKSRGVFVGAAADTLFNVPVQLGESPTFSWPQSQYEWQTPDDGVTIRSLLVLGTEQLQDLFVGTDRGLYVLRGGPGLGDAVKLEDCPALSADSGRPPPSVVRIQALAQFGSRLFIGTDSGLAVSSTLAEAETEAELQAASSSKAEAPKDERDDPPADTSDAQAICIRWLPTRVATAAGAPVSMLPILPAGLNVTDLVVSEGRLYVLSLDNGLFFLNGEVDG